MISTESNSGQIGTQGLREDGQAIGKHARDKFAGSAMSALTPAIKEHWKKVHEDIDKREAENPLPAPEGGKAKRGLIRTARMVRRTAKNHVEVVRRVGESKIPHVIKQEIADALLEGVAAVVTEKLKGKPKNPQTPKDSPLE